MDSRVGRKTTESIELDKYHYSWLVYTLLWNAVNDSEYHKGGESTKEGGAAYA